MREYEDLLTVNRIFVGRTKGSASLAPTRSAGA
jgi:hypothetical protein